MKIIEMTGKTVEEAVKNALQELKLTEDKVKIDIIEEGSKGIFKVFGVKLAKVKVTVKDDYLDNAKTFLSDVLKSMNVSGNINIIEEKDVLKIDLEGPDMGAIIGHRGEALDSLQYLTSLVVNKSNKDAYKKVVLDAGNYRTKREETLINLASKSAYKVRRYGKNLKLEPMNPYERKIIHSTLQEDPYVETYSEGEGPNRRIVIALKKKAE